MMKCYRRPGAPAIAFTPRCQPSSGCSRFWPLSCAGISPPRRRYMHGTGQTATPTPGTSTHPGCFRFWPLSCAGVSPPRRRYLHGTGQTATPTPGTSAHPGPHPIRPGYSRFWPLPCAGVSPPRRRYVHSTGQTATPAPGTPIHPGPHPSPLLRWALSPLKRRILPHHRGQPTPSSTLLRWTLSLLERRQALPSTHPRGYNLPHLHRDHAPVPFPGDPELHASLTPATH